MKRYHNVAIYVQDLDPSNGGIERVSYILSKELARRGYHIYAIHIDKLPSDKNIYEHYEGLCCGNAEKTSDIPDIIEFVKENHIEIFLNQISKCFSSVALQRAIKNETSAFLIDVLHTMPLQLVPLKEFYHPLPLPRFINRWMFSIHKAVNLKPRYRRGNIISYSLCDAFVMLSRNYFSEFAKDNKINDFSKFYAIANPYEFTYKDLYPVHKEKVMLVVARLNNQQKRIDRTLRFWKNFHKEGDGWKLVIVGDGPDKGMLISLSKDLGLKDCFFKGHSSHPGTEYRRSMIFLMTSDSEGFGMTLVEAMSAGCVPIAMDCFSALPDVVTNRENGMIVPKNDINAMASAVVYTIANFEKMSANARVAAKRFSVYTITDKWEELFNSL